MSFLQQKWSEYSRQPNPPRRYSSAREFEADWVSGLRRRHGLSQEALANLAGVSVTTVQNWENPQSRKAIAPHNQERLREIERELWIGAHVTLIEPCPPHIRALYDLMRANKDESAQALAEYLISMLDLKGGERARLLHWAALAYSIADPTSPRARELETAALAALGAEDGPLSAAIENEILGSQFEELMRLPEGPVRREKGYQIMEACDRLFKRDPQPAYKWNALEVACRTPLARNEMQRLIGELESLLGPGRVRQRLLNEPAYQAARTFLAAPECIN